MEYGNMSDQVGKAAGILWEHLNVEGETSVSKLIKATGLDSKTAQRAIGWLAKEDKLMVIVKGRTELVALK